MSLHRREERPRRGNGPSAAVPRQPADQRRYENAYLRARSVRRAARAAASLCPSPTYARRHAAPSRMEPRAMSPSARTLSWLFDRAGLHIDRKESHVPRKHHPDLAAFPFARTEPGGSVWNICAPTGSMPLNALRAYDDIIDAACDAWRRSIAEHRRYLNGNARFGAYRSNIMTLAGSHQHHNAPIKEPISVPA